VRLEHDITLAALIEDYWRAHATPNLEPQTRVAICERHYAGIFEDYDPANRTSAEAAIRAAREPGVCGNCALTDARAED
jgi:hypothetical protein